jgi:hypothetical protein
LDAIGIPDGARIGTFINFAAHPTAIGSSNLELSSDWIHYTRVTAEARLGAPVVFSNGAIGDVSPQPSGEGDQFERASVYGADIANLAVDSIPSQVQISSCCSSSSSSSSSSSKDEESCLITTNF